MLEEKGNSSVQLNGVQMQRAIPLDSPLEWKQALTGIRHSFFHTWEHCYAMYLTTKQPTFLYCAEGSGKRVVCPFVERSYGDVVDIATPYGFSGFAGNGAFFNFAENWNRFAVGRGYISGYINQHPLFTRLDDLRSDTVYRQKTLYVMNLTRGLEELFDNCSRSRRRELHRWENLVTVVTDRTTLTTFFLEHYRDFFQRKKASSVYEFTPETITFLLSLDNVVAIGAGRGAELEAVNVFAYTPHAAEGIFNLSLPQGSCHGAGLIWRAVKHLVGIGIPAFNLGAGIIESDSLARFKRSFGAEPFPLYALKQVYANESYQQVCLRSDVDPTDRDGYFPNYRASCSPRDL